MKIFESIDVTDKHKQILKYIETNPCCVDFPKCKHFHYQSDSHLFDQDFMQDIKDNFFKAVEYILQKPLDLDKVKKFKSWAYSQNKGDKLKESFWHQHSFDASLFEISGILYLTDTKFGTEFDYGHYHIITKPQKNFWYMWDSKISHRPQVGIVNKKRTIITAAIAIDHEYHR